MRILHVTDTFLPRLGGIELHVSDLATRQQAAGHEVRVLTAETTAARERDDMADPVPGELAVDRIATRLGLGLGAALRSLVADFAPDVVHAHLTVGSPFTWAVLRNIHDVPTVGTLHSLLPDRPALVRAGLRITGVPADRIVFTAVSEAAAARLRPALRRGQPVQVLHNGIDPSAWQVAHRPTGGFEILAVGRLAPRKRPLVLIDVLAALASRAPDLAWSATLVGDGPQRGQVVQAIRAAGLDGRVHLTGALSRAEIRELLGRADAFVAPSTLESFGIAALEARCAGVPIIGMAASGVTEFVTHGVDGLLAASDAELSTCLERLATEAGLVTAIRAHNTAVRVPMAWDDVLESHVDLYRYAAAVPAHRASSPERPRRRLVPAGGSGSLRRRA
jgi:glycosyltransferase involved in cell wall biosynthesis